MKNRKLTIATRESALALWQANHVKKELLKHWPDLNIDLLPMRTSGDKFNKTKLLDLGGKGLFVKELEEALLDKRADLAVHSMKDVPAECPRGLELPIICKRENPFDVLIIKHYPDLQALPKGSIIGTSSLRRQAQLLAHRPDLTIKFLRGNIMTRQKKLKEEAYDAIILAAAGLERMEMESRISETLSPEIMLPACGQGALGIECRQEDHELKHLLAPLNDPLSFTCVSAERLVNARLGGNCHVPLAVYCEPINNTNKVLLRAKVCSEDGQIIIETQEQVSLDQALQAANQCAEKLMSQGADRLLSTGSL